MALHNNLTTGSGDAQTLCITDDDNVWSFGDGDYGKLGRGGSDGCKTPLKIESLAGLGVFKVQTYDLHQNAKFNWFAVIIMFENLLLYFHLDNSALKPQLNCMPCHGIRKWNFLKSVSLNFETYSLLHYF